ncbi:hypothetical protein TRVA0_011S00914 [Trichomonascus vanleenenianus]|uniref:WD40 repeat domain-containing protein n=1 Tax=Trichomonascus vanleenenianus TaxID=2268995 RepID=UPI003ECA71CF
MDQLPVQFGKQTAVFDPEPRFKQAARPEYLERLKKKQQEEESESDESEDELDELPTTHEYKLSPHESKVTSISADPTGNRIVTSSLDTSIRFWDFNGMDSSTLTPFKQVYPDEDGKTTVTQSLFSTDGSVVLAVLNTPKPKLYSRDGDELGEFSAGDMYLMDMKNTKGHVSMVNGASWHPTSASRFLTYGEDSTVRIWEAESFKSQKSVIFVKEKGKKCKITAAQWCDSATVISVSDSNTLALWDTKTPMLRPKMSVEKIFGEETYTSCVVCSSQMNMLITRNSSGIKQWDTRKLKTPVLQRLSGIGTESRYSNVEYSPDSQYLVTTSSSGLHILDTGDLSDVQLLTFNTASPESASWVKATNQIMVGMANGDVECLFNRETSSKGVLQVITRAPKVRHVEDVMTTTNVTLTAVDLESLSSSRKRKRNIVKPSVPQTVAHSWGAPDVEYLEATGINTEDPREALLKYAKKVDEKKKRKD